MPPNDRGSLLANLVPDEWVCLFQKEDPYGDPAFFEHHVRFAVSAFAGDQFQGGGGQHAVTQPVTIQVQDSPDGITWTARHTHPIPLRPGGRLEIDYPHVQRYVRVLLFSTAAGEVTGTILEPTDQVLPQLVLSAGQVVDGTAEPPGGHDPAPQPDSDCPIAYDFESRLDWVAQGDAQRVFPDLDLYTLSAIGPEVIFYANMFGVNLTLNTDAHPVCAALPLSPELITGGFAQPNDFRVWYNQWSDCSLEQAPTVTRVTITNTGANPISVSKGGAVPVVIAPLGVYTDNAGFAYAGYDNGNQSGWGAANGTLYEVREAC